MTTRFLERELTEQNNCIVPVLTHADLRVNGRVPGFCRFIKKFSCPSLFNDVHHHDLYNLGLIVVPSNAPTFTMTGPHPYYPPDLTFIEYIPNTHSPIALIGAWAGALSFVTITTFVWLAPKKLSITERLITLWFVTSNHCLHGLTIRC